MSLATAGWTHSCTSAGRAGQTADCSPYRLEPSVFSDHLNSCIPLYLLKYRKSSPHNRIAFSRSIIHNIQNHRLLFLCLFLLRRVGASVSCVSSFMPEKGSLKTISSSSSSFISATSDFHFSKNTGVHTGTGP